MKTSITHYLLLVFIFFFTSCATVLNRKEVRMKISTAKGEHLVVKGDTIKPFFENTYELSVLRSKDSLPLIIYNDSSSKRINLPSRNSLAYWLNIYPGVHLWTGFLIDKNTPKRYTYPRKLKIGVTQKENYRTTLPSKWEQTTYSNILKLTPTKIHGSYSPGIELSYERKTSDYFSTCVMASYLLRTSSRDRFNGHSEHAKGVRFALEEKLYFKKTAPVGPYMGFELDYLKRNYEQETRFEFKTPPVNASPFYRDTVKIQRQSYSLNFKAGYQCIAGHFSFEFYAGLGVRYRDVKHIYKDTDKGQLAPGRNGGSGMTRFSTKGTYYTLSVPVNFRIGWAF